MARRSPMNERYQKNTAPAGKTRKSAASAKPKRASATGPTKKSASKPSTRPTNPMLVNPDTDEFRLWRRIWWIMLAGSAALTFGSLAVRQWLELPMVANVMLVLGYVGIFGALALDWMKIRRLRTEWVEQQQRAASSKKSPTDGKTNENES